MRGTKRWAGICAICLVAFAQHADAQADANLLAEVTTASSTVVARWNDLPEQVRASFSTHKISGMSDAGGPFNPSDVGMLMMRSDAGHEGELTSAKWTPHIRLLFGAKSDATWLVCYETGGISHSYHLAEVHLAADASTSPIWTHYLLKHRIFDLGTLNAAISNHDYWQPPEQP